MRLALIYRATWENSAGGMFADRMDARLLMIEWSNYIENDSFGNLSKEVKCI